MCENRAKQKSSVSTDVQCLRVKGIRANQIILKWQGVKDHFGGSPVSSCVNPSRVKLSFALRVDKIPKLLGKNWF